jgi:hypothetical protein
MIITNPDGCHGPPSRGEGSPVPPGNVHPHTNGWARVLGRIDGQTTMYRKFSYMQIILEMKTITLHRQVLFIYMI